MAGDNTADTMFVLFGRIAQRLLRKPVEALIEKTPENSNFIPDEITGLLEKEFVWNVSFTENTLKSGEISFQVNSIVSIGGTRLPPLLMSPGGSQASSSMMPPGPSNSAMSPQRGSELAIASPPSSTIASPLAKHYVAAPKKQSISSTAPDTPTSKCSIVPAEDDSVNPISLPMSQSATNTAIKVLHIPHVFPPWYLLSLFSYV